MRRTIGMGTHAGELPDVLHHAAQAAAGGAAHHGHGAAHDVVRDAAAQGVEAAPLHSSSSF